MSPGGSAFLGDDESSDIDVDFCDPHSVWQRGTNENTDGLLRQYLPRSTGLATDTASQLN